MIRKILLAGAAAAAFSTLVSAGAADATTLIFNGTPGTTLSSADNGFVTFSLGSSGSAYAYSNGAPAFGGIALTNSQTAEYPTANILNVYFGGYVSNVSFTFTNYGSNGNGVGSNGKTHVTVYGGYGYGNGYLTSINLGGEGCAISCTKTVSDSYGNPLSYVTQLQFNNGERGGRSWIYGLESITFTGGPSGVPEPSTWAMMLGGFGFLGFVLRRRVQRAATSA